MESDIDELNEIEILYFVLCSRILLFRQCIRNFLFSRLGVYPERRKIVVRILHTRLHITISVEDDRQFHWIGTD